MTAYLALSSIILLLFAVAVLIIIRILRPAASFYWLLAAAAALIAWSLLLLASNNLPQSIVLFQWQPEWIFRQSPRILVDRHSWAFAFSLASLSLATILTDAARSGSTNWFGWTANLVLCAFGVAGVLAGNLLTLLLIWTAIDIIETIIYLTISTDSASDYRYIASIATRVAGTFLLIWMTFFTVNPGEWIDDFAIAGQSGIVLMAVAILRAGVFPLRWLYVADSNLRRSLGTVARLVTAGTGMILVTRAAMVEYHPPSSTILILSGGIVASYCAISWVVSREELDAQPYWILGLLAFAIGSALQSQPDASTAWSVSAILSGGLLTLITIRHRYLMVLPLVGLLGITALPFTPAWNGVLLYAPRFNLLLVLFMLSQSIFMLGYLRHSLRRQSEQSSLEQWVWVIYPWGLAILPLSAYIIGWLGWSVQLRLSTLLPGLLVALMTGLWLAIDYRLKEPPRLVRLARRVVLGINERVTLEWLHQASERVIHPIGRSISFISTVLEGDGGVLWAIFFLVLFTAILTQIRLGV